MRVALILVVIIALGVGAWALYGNLTAPATQLLPTWQLTQSSRYSGIGMTDPFVSWSPDSRTVLFSVMDMRFRNDIIYRWNVGENELQRIAVGASPNFLSAREFAYLKREPKSFVVRDLASGQEREFAPAVKRTQFWNEVTAFTYDPTAETITLRLIEATRYYTPGTEVYDTSGKRIGDVGTRLSEGIVDFSPNPDGSASALLVQETEGAPLSLQIADKGKSRGNRIMTGNLTSVAWSPDGEVIACGESVLVHALRPSDGKRLIVARFGDPDDPLEKRYVSRLSWSPDSKFLAVLLYVPSDMGDYPLIYVLSMSGLKWDR